MQKNGSDNIKFVREKKVYHGKDFLDVSITYYTTEQERRLPKCKRKRLTNPSQRNLNDQNSRQYFVWLVNCNFGEDDYLLDLTYSIKPESREAAEKELTNCLKRLRRLYDKHGVEFKYVAVTEGGRDKENGEITRLHHHLIISGGVPRKDIKKTWSMGRSKCDEVQLMPGEQGLAGRANYMTKAKRQSEDSFRKRWRASHNLKKPVEQVNDNKYTPKKLDKMIEAKSEGTLSEMLKKLYKNYNCIDTDLDFNKVTGFPQLHFKFIRI